MDNEKFDDCISVDSHLVTSGVNMVAALCESHGGAPRVGGAEREGEDTEPEVVLNFAEVLYANNNSDCDRGLSLESSFFELRRKVSTKQLSITEFLQKN
jgi:hypothetical protein